MAKIRIYGVIGSYWDECDAQSVIARIDKHSEDEPIDVHINSVGGSVKDGVAIHNVLARRKGKITVYIDGLAASSASVIAMAGDEVVIPENAMLMIHNPWTVAIGDHDEMRKVAGDLEKHRNAILASYKRKTGKTEDELKAMLDAETWLTAAEAVDHGFADRIEEELDANALASVLAIHDLEKFNNVPPGIAQAAAQGKRLAVMAAVRPTTGVEMGVKTKNKAGQAEPSTAADTTDVSAQLSEAERRGAELEAERQATIRARARALQLPDAAIDAIVARNLSVEESNGLILDAIVNRQRTDTGGAEITGTSRHSLGFGRDEQEKFAKGVENALLVRSGMEDEETEFGNEFRSYSLFELSRMSLERRGISTRHMSKREVVGESFVASAGRHAASDFPAILANVAHKSMLEGWEEEDTAFDKWTDEENLSDFKIAERVALNQFPMLQQVAPGAQYEYATFGDRKELIWLVTWGSLFAIDRHSIINDDLGAFTAIPQMMGAAAKRTIDYLVSEMLINGDDAAKGQKMTEDGKVVFHADHKNLITDKFGVAGLAKARKNMRTHKDKDGKGTLKIRPSYLILPAALETEADILLNSTVHPDKANNAKNPVANFATPVIDPNLDEASETAWYAAGRRGAISVAYLDGNNRPFMDRVKDYTVDGAQYKIGLDAGARFMDYRPILKSTGTT